MISVILAALVFYLYRSRDGSAGKDIYLLEKGQERIERLLPEEFSRLRGEQRDSVKAMGDSLFSQVTNMASLTEKNLEGVLNQFAGFRKELESTRQSLDMKMKAMQDENSARLEKITGIVDEKLHETLQSRLGNAFKQVSDQLEQVHKGLGEMRSLAASVGSLEKTLANVKTRGVWGEVALEALLEQIMHPGQYEKNVATRPRSNERVEFAIKLPGAGDNGSIWLPVDAKFPVEDYIRLVEAQDKGDPAGADAAAKSLETKIKTFAKSIRDKYLEPPHTTDFGVMFLPTEGLYAEVLRRPGLAEGLQREFRVVVAGPVTLAALLNSLQMGFKTLAVEKRAGDVWRVVESLRVEFGKFGDLLARTRKKIEDAATSMDDVESRARVITKTLGRAQKLDEPPGEENAEAKN